MSLVNKRQNPIDTSTSPVTITDEAHTVAEFTELPGVYGFYLEERPVSGTVSVREDNTAETPFTIVNAAPSPGQVFIDYNSNRGMLIFNIADDATAIIVTYNGLGTNQTVENTKKIALETPLSDYVVGSNTAIANTDTLYEALGKVQGQINSSSAGVADQIHAATDKATPDDADELGLADSAASWGLKKLTFANLKAWLITAVQTALANLLVPVGAYIDMAGSTVPGGYLACNGAAHSRSTYAALFAYLGTTYGAGDGSTTFNVPDARGLVMVGAGAHGTMTRANGTAYNGGTLGATRNDQMQGHRHPIDDETAAYGSGTAYFSHQSRTTTQATRRSGDPTTDTTNGTPRTGDETRPAEIAVLVCIKY